MKLIRYGVLGSVLLLSGMSLNAQTAKPEAKATQPQPQPSVALQIAQERVEIANLKLQLQQALTLIKQLQGALQAVQANDPVLSAAQKELDDATSEMKQVQNTEDKTKK